jgi:hypothetical protein
MRHTPKPHQIKALSERATNHSKLDDATARFDPFSVIHGIYFDFHCHFANFALAR